jgi:hypothetical protein
LRGLNFTCYVLYLILIYLFILHLMLHCFWHLTFDLWVI